MCLAAVMNSRSQAGGLKNSPLRARRKRRCFSPGTLQRSLSSGFLSTPFGVPNETRVLSRSSGMAAQLSNHQASLAYAGYQFREQQGENDTGLINRILSSHAGFAQAQFNLWDRVFATAGIRHDSYNVFGDATTTGSPAATTIRKQIPNLRVRLFHRISGAQHE